MEKIVIIYDVKQKVEFSFWKLFFEWAGLWVITRPYEERGLLKNSLEMKTCYILSYDTEKFISEKESKDIFYLLRAKSKENEGLRKDICKMDWRNRIKSRKVISWLFSDEEKQRELLELFAFYCKYNFWKYLWLTQEFLVNKGDVDLFGKQILLNCQACMKDIEDQYDIEKDIYAGYAYFYCQYIRLLLEERLWGIDTEVVKRSAEYGMRILETRKVDATWYILLAKLCGINMELKHRMLPYYEKALFCIQSEELLFNVGRIYEKGYGRWRKASQYYHKSYQMNPKFYRAIYKLGVEAEKERNWKQAITYYHSLENELITDLKYDQASIRSLEYLCKVWNRQGTIYSKVTSAVWVGEAYKRKLRKIYDSLEEYIDRKEEGNKKIKNIEIISKFGKFFNCADFNHEEVKIVVEKIKMKLELLNC